MSQPAVKALAPLPSELVYDDGEPMDSFKHVRQMVLLIETIEQAMAERGRSDFFAGGNMFVYYSYEQAWDVKAGRAYFRGPDVFFVDGVPGGDRNAWVAWDEGDRLPDLIVELLSPSTEKVDRVDKMDLYARVFRTRDYFLCDPDRQELEGFRLVGDTYQAIAPDRQGRLRSDVLGLDLGFWEGIPRAQGVRPKEKATWLRLFRPDGRLVPTAVEARDAKVEAAEARAEAAEAELKRLRS